MNNIFQILFPRSHSSNIKSKACAEQRRMIQILKWVRIIAIIVAFTISGARAGAQQPKKVPRIGFLATVSPATISDRVDAFREGLRELGYVEGKNIVIEWRYEESQGDRLPPPGLVAELVRLKVDLIITVGSLVTRSA